MEAKQVGDLRNYGRKWWYYAQLRNQGKHAEARSKEIESTRNLIKDLRKGQVAGVALAGVWLKYDSVSCSGMGNDIIPVILQWSNIPFVDKRTVDRDNLEKFVIRSPLVNCTIKTIEGTGGCDHIPIGCYCAVWEILGATVRWGRLESERSSWLQNRFTHEIVNRMRKP